MYIEEKGLQIIQGATPLGLAEALLRALEKQDPLWGKRQLIVVPSPAYRMWLEEWLTEQLGVLIGAEWCALDELPDRLGFPGGRAPLPVEWGAFLEDCFLTDPELGGAHTPGALAATLSYLFGQYGIYGQDLLTCWPQETPMALAQKKLWDRFFAQHPQLMPLIERLQLPQVRCEPCCVHLMAQSSTPRAWLHWLEKLSHHHAITLYTLVATPLFQGDLIPSKWASRHLSDLHTAGLRPKIVEEQMTWLLERQPLLADLGTVSRLFQRDLEYFCPNAPVLEASPSEVNEPASTLEHLRRDLALLERSTPAAPLKETVLLHITRSELHEAEVAIRRVLELIQEDPSLQWEHIAVACSDPARYRPLLEGVMAQWGYSLPLRWVDGGPWSPTADWLFHLLTVLPGRWSLCDIQPLLIHPMVTHLFGWDEESVLTVTEWLRNQGIWWGRDAEHRNTWLTEQMAGAVEPPEVGARGTWHHQLHLLLEQILLDPAQREMEPSQWPLLSVMLQILHLLMDAHQKIMRAATCTICEAAAILSTVLEELGCAQDADGERVLQLLQSITHNHHLADHPLPPSRALHWLSTTLRALHKPPAKGGIWAGSLSALRGIGVRVCLLLGMEQRVFPTPWNPEPFNLLTGYDRFPSRGEYDRLCLLETLLCTEERLECFAACPPHLQEPRAVSAPIAELFAQCAAISQRPCKIVHSWELNSPQREHPPEAPREVADTNTSLRCTPHQLQQALHKPYELYLRRSVGWRPSRCSWEEPIQLSQRMQYRTQQELLLGEAPTAALPRGRLREPLEQILVTAHHPEAHRYFLGEAPYASTQTLCHPPLLVPCQGHTLSIEGPLGVGVRGMLLLPTNKRAELWDTWLPVLCIWRVLYPAGPFAALNPSGVWEPFSLDLPEPFEVLSALAAWWWLASQEPVCTGPLHEKAWEDPSCAEELWRATLEDLGVHAHLDPPHPSDAARACAASLRTWKQGVHA